MVSINGFPNVVLVKFPEIDEVDLGFVSKALEHFFNKVGAGAKLQLTLKEYKKGGLKSQHEIHAKLIVGNKSFFAEDESWQLLKTVQNVLKKLEKEVLKESSKEK